MNVMTDHEGKQYKSEKEMCDAWGVHTATFNSRMVRGWSLKDALTVKAVPRCRGSSIKCTDHLGNHFDSLLEMCEHHGVTVNAYYNRYYRGLDLEEALNKDYGRVRGKSCVDHKGIVYKSKKEMCKAY